MREHNGRLPEDEAVDGVLAEVPEMSERAFRDGRERLLAAMAAERFPEREAEVIPLRRAPRRTRWLVGAAAGVALLVGGALLAPTLSVVDGPVANSAQAAEVLNRAAANLTIGTRPDPLLRPGQFRYVRVHGWIGAPSLDRSEELFYLAETNLETWIPAEQRQQWLYRRKATGQLRLVNGDEADAREDAKGVQRGLDGEWRAEDGRFFEGPNPVTRTPSLERPTPEFQAALPKDPKQLYEQLRRDADAGHQLGDKGLLQHVVNGMNSGLLTAETRANVYRALANMPGLRVLKDTETLDGRKGTALGVTADGFSQQIVVDPETGEFIGQQQVAVDESHGMDVGTVIHTTSVRTAVVDGQGQTG